MENNVKQEFMIASPAAMAARIDPAHLAGYIPPSQLSFDGEKALNEADKPTAEVIYARAMTTLSIPPYAEKAVVDCRIIGTTLHKAVFDAFAVGRAQGKLEAERLHRDIACAQDSARTDMLLPTCVAITMEAAGMTEMTLTLAEMPTVWDRVRLDTIYDAETTSYRLREKETGDG